jgi:hypothetical protein
MVGGARVLEQKLRPVHTQLNASLLFLGCVALQCLLSLSPNRSIVRVVTLLLPVAFFSAYPNPHELVMVNTTHEGVAPSVLTPHSHAERAVLPMPKQMNYIPEPQSPRVPPRHLARHHRLRTRAQAVEVNQTLRSSDGVLERNPATAEERYLEASAHSVAVSDTTRRGIQKFSHGYALMLIVV